MLKNYFKIAIRNILKNKVYSFINIVGFSIGLAVSILIFLYIQFEFSYDKFNRNFQEIYRVVGDDYATTPAPLAKSLQEEFSSILKTVRIAKEDKILVSNGNKRFYEGNVFFADPSFFEIFSFPLIIGNPKSALKEPLSILLTYSSAKKYFGNKNPLGQILRFDNKLDLKVTGVLKNIPINSHFHPDFLISMSSTKNIYGNDFLTNILNTTVYTYILINSPANAIAIKKMFPVFIKKYYGGLTEFLKPTFVLQPLSSIHLNSNLGGEIEANDNIDYVYLFGVIGILILFMACINYTNIITAKYSGRIKEIGIRKVLGADKYLLIKQFVGESIIIASFSVIISVMLVELFLPIYNSKIDQPLTLDFTNNFNLIIAIICITIFTGIISGIYPAIILSTLNPSQIFRKLSYRKLKGTSIVKLLVVFQFLISTGLIISTIVISQQLNYLRNKKLGFGKEHVVVLPLREDYTRRHYEILKNKLLNISNVVSVSGSSVLPGDIKYYSSFRLGESKNWETMDFIYADYDFIKTYKITLKEGRDFSKSFVDDQNVNCILNEEAVKKLGLKNPIGHIFETRSISKGTVIGIVKDFNYKNLHQKINPLYIAINQNGINYLSIKIKAINVPSTLGSIKEEWGKVFPQSPYEFFFFNEHIHKLYKSENILADIFDWFSGLGIIISFLGLFGLAYISTIKRTKEIGIRKVLGASPAEIIILISKEFIVLVIIANLIAYPLVWYGIRKWLQSFAYRIDINIWSFLFTSCIVILIALMTISILVVKVSKENPVKSLRYE